MVEWCLATVSLQKTFYLTDFLVLWILIDQV
jgi:hypothetical protein